MISPGFIAREKEDTPPFQIPQRAWRIGLKRLSGAARAPDQASQSVCDYRKFLKFFLGGPSTFTEAASNERSFRRCQYGVLGSGLFRRFSMLGINSNINSLVAQQNLNGSQSALSQAITRLSSGKRINSAADDAAGLAISTRMQTQINGLGQGVSNANDGVSLIQTASSALSSLTSSLQRIRTLAVQASTGTMSSSDQAALQKEVAQQIQEVNRIASQTTYNGTNILDGSAGIVGFQVGANVGQTINLDLSKSMSAASLGSGSLATGQLAGTISNLNIDAATGAAATSTPSANIITSINVLSDGHGGFSFTDQNGSAISSAAASTIFSAGAQTNATLGAPVTTLTMNTAAYDQTNAALDKSVLAATAQIGAVNASNTSVSKLDISTVSGANVAMVAIDNALTAVSNLQASLGAAQNRFSAIATSQQAEATDLSSAQSQITDANFAQETRVVRFLAFRWKARLPSSISVTPLTHHNGRTEHFHVNDYEFIGGERGISDCRSRQCSPAAGHAVGHHGRDGQFVAGRVDARHGSRKFEDCRPGCRVDGATKLGQHPDFRIRHAFGRAWRAGNGPHFAVQRRTPEYFYRDLERRHRHHRDCHYGRGRRQLQRRGLAGRGVAGAVVVGFHG
jgi:flagellin